MSYAEPRALIMTMDFNEILNKENLWLNVILTLSRLTCGPLLAHLSH